MKARLSHTGWIIFWFFSVWTSLQGQMGIENIEALGKTPEELIEQMILGEGIKIIDIQFKGSVESIGAFTDPENKLGMPGGLVLSTGDVSLIDDPNIFGNTSSSGKQDFPYSDPDLESLSVHPLNDQVAIEIEFVAQTSRLQFNYVFASEEYPEFVCSQFNDIFSFFISGPRPDGGEYKAFNLALVPDPMDSTGSGFTEFPVSTNSVNPGIPGTAITDAACDAPGESLLFSNYYNDNSDNPYFMFDGYLDKFSAIAEVIPCQRYVIRMVLADSRDHDYDSAVFLEEKSFKSPSIQYSVLTPDKSGLVSEGCDPMLVVVEKSFTTSANDSFPLDIGVVDHDLFANSSEYILSKKEFTFNEGQTKDSIWIYFQDNDKSEADRTVVIAHQFEGCVLDSSMVILRDNTLPKLVEFDKTLERCEDEPLEFNFPPDNPNFYIHSNPAISNMDSSGSSVLSMILGVEEQAPAIPRAVCILGLNELSIENYQMLLVLPDGRSTELDLSWFHANESTENEMCLILIPEDVNGLSRQLDLSFGDQLIRDINMFGQWELVLFSIDPPERLDQRIEWRLRMTPSYSYQLEISKLGTPDEDINTLAHSDTLSWAASDNLGCRLTDSLVVMTHPRAELPRDLNCRLVERDILEFAWHQDSIGSKFEVLVDNRGPDTINEFRWIEAQLKPEQLVKLKIRTLDANCSSDFVELSCQAPPCKEPELSLVSISPPSSSCLNDGAMKLSSSETKGPYTFSLGGMTNFDGVFNQLSTGEYFGKVVDGFGCENQMDIELVGIEPMDMTFSTRPINCLEEGIIEVQVDGGRGPFSYMWSDGQFVRSPQFSSPGHYSVTITDNDLCVIEGQIELEAIPPPAIIGFDLVQNLCPGEAQGEIRAIEIDGRGPFQFQLLNDQGTYLNDLTGLGAGRFELVVVDSLGCEARTSFIMEEVIEVKPVVNASHVSCHMGRDGSISIDTSTVPNLLEVIWTGPNQAMFSGVRIDNLESGVYNVSIQDQDGCIVLDTIEIREPYAALEAQTKITDPSCFGWVDGSMQITTSGGVPPYQYSLDGENYQDNPNLANLGAGQYSVFVQDKNGCSLEFPERSLNEPPEMNVFLDFDTLIYEGEDVNISARVNNANGDLSFSWLSDPPNIIDCNTCDAFTIKRIDGTVVIAVEVRDENGCVSYDEQKIFVNRPNHIEVPMAFSPNGDNLNDKLSVFGTPGSEILEFTIYENSGIRVFRTTELMINDRGMGWDGTFSGATLKSGQYIWACSVRFPDGRLDSFTGSVHLIR